MFCIRRNYLNHVYICFEWTFCGEKKLSATCNKIRISGYTNTQVHTYLLSPRAPKWISKLTLCPKADFSIRTMSTLSLGQQLDSYPTSLRVSLDQACGPWKFFIWPMWQWSFLSTTLSTAPLLIRIWEGEMDGGLGRKRILWGKEQTKRDERGKTLPRHWKSPIAFFLGIPWHNTSQLQSDTLVETTLWNAWTKYQSTSLGIKVFPFKQCMNSFYTAYNWISCYHVLLLSPSPTPTPSHG